MKANKKEMKKEVIDYFKEAYPDMKVCDIQCWYEADIDCNLIHVVAVSKRNHTVEKIAYEYMTNWNTSYKLRFIRVVGTM